VQDTEEWDDVHEMESQAVGTLNHVLDMRGDGSKCFIHIIDDSPKKKRNKFVELGSSDDEEDTNFNVSRVQHPTNSVVVNQFRFIVIISFIHSFKYLYFEGTLGLTYFLAYEK